MRISHALRHECESSVLHLMMTLLFTHGISWSAESMFFKDSFYMRRKSFGDFGIIMMQGEWST